MSPPDFLSFALAVVGESLSEELSLCPRRSEPCRRSELAEALGGIVPGGREAVRLDRKSCLVATCGPAV